ncbi:MAG: heme-copper oxidase subunit III [Anaerolineae bacterium]|nr:heme-copper oxidase subunit III [Anaerolineae bacterium]
MEHASTHAVTTETEGGWTLDMRKLGIWIFLSSENMLFIALIGAFLVNLGRAETGPYPGNGHFTLNLPLTAFNTFVLLTSSFSMVKAYDAITRNDQGRFRMWLLTTIVFGAFFLSVQGIEYYKLAVEEGLTPTVNQFGTTFYILTGIHGAHVLVGVLWLIGVMLFSYGDRFNAENAVPVDMAALYWHFVDLVWVFIFMFVYLVPPILHPNVVHP